MLTLLATAFQTSILSTTRAIIASRTRGLPQVAAATSENGGRIMSDGIIGTATATPPTYVRGHRERHGPGRVISRAFRQHPVWMGVVVLVCATIVVLAIGGYFMDWTWTGFKGNTFWDWLSLLITPVTIATVSTLFSYQQSQWTMASNERKRQEEALQAYFDHMSHLLLERDLLRTPPDSPVRAVAQARTAATLRQLGQEHRASMLRFLGEAGLTRGETPVLDLTAIDRDTPSALGFA